MKEYETPEVEVVSFSVSDVITSSVVNDVDDRLPMN